MKELRMTMQTLIDAKTANKRRVIGHPPAACEICSRPIPYVAIDGKTVGGPWGWMCEECHRTYGVGFGLGLGQRYERSATENQFVKVAG